MKSYDRCSPEVLERCHRLIDKWHRQLEAVELKLDLLFVSTDSESTPALTCGGVRALATVQIMPSKLRALGLGDALITIDQGAYNAMSDEEKDALLDHELYHLAPQFDKDGAYKTDDQHRPCLALRKHDVQVGWFAEVAARHGKHSHEQQQARQVFDTFGNSIMPFIAEEVRGT